MTDFSFSLGVGWPGILLAALVALAVSFYWYSEKIFGKRWMKASGMSKKKASEINMKQATAGTFASYFFQATALSIVFNWAGADSWKEGFAIGLFTGLLFAVTTLVPNWIWQKKTLELLLINGGHAMAVLIAMGIVLGFLA